MKSRLGYFNDALYPLELDMIAIVLQVCNRQQGLKGDHPRGDNDGVYTLPFCT